MKRLCLYKYIVYEYALKKNNGHARKECKNWTNFFLHRDEQYQRKILTEYLDNRSFNIYFIEDVYNTLTSTNSSDSLINWLLEDIDYKTNRCYLIPLFFELFHYRNWYGLLEKYFPYRAPFRERRIIADLYNSIDIENADTDKTLDAAYKLLSLMLPIVHCEFERCDYNCTIIKDICNILDRKKLSYSIENIRNIIENSFSNLCISSFKLNEITNSIF